jgi:hypothetical protein
MTKLNREISNLDDISILVSPMIVFFYEQQQGELEPTHTS